MTLIAQRPLKSKDYGRVRPGEWFEVENPETVQGLLRQGLASIAPVSVSTYETKVIVAAPVVAAQPFRDLYMPDTGQPAQVPADSDPVLSVTEVPEQGTPDPPRRKRGRPRKHL